MVQHSKASKTLSKVHLAKRAKPDAKTGESKGERDFARQSDPKRGLDTASCKELRVEKQAARRRSQK
jgi:hypothetical protein